ncbi:hypothetical protein LXL81_09885 [Dyadobacter sp. CY356]|nr:hypothetical protein [Dyadobacter sp. CY356]
MSKKLKALSISLASLLVFGLAGTVFNSCKSDDPVVVACSEGILNYEDLNSKSSLSAAVLDTNSVVNLVITSQQQYERYIANRNQSIDFDSKMLLAGSYFTDSAAHVVSQLVTSDCGAGKVTYHVEVVRTKGVLTTRQHVEYFAIVPKLPDGTEVKFDVAYKK